MNRSPRPLAAPWRIETLDTAFKVVTANGLTVAYVYHSDDPTRLGGMLTRDEARRVAANIARIPDMKKPATGLG